jgi:two-component system CheB/CheR fusion protein
MATGKTKKASKAPRKRASKPARKVKNKDIFPVVGIGASAGGLEAIEGFIDNIPPVSNIAFVIIQHLAPRYKSLMGTLLQKHTKLKVLEIEDGMKVEPNCVYVNPPDRYVSIKNSSLYLTEMVKKDAVKFPVDFFFRSLAEESGERALGVILSGTGTDGTSGLKVIKGEGGIGIVQEPDQARFSGMPKSAVDSGVADYVLPVGKIPAQILKYAKYSYIDRVHKTFDALHKTFAADKRVQANVQKIFDLVRSATGSDFSHYKKTTTFRRIKQRMAVNNIKRLEDYLLYLQKNRDEVDELFKSLIIRVTSFFRDPKAFDFLGKSVLPDWLEGQVPGSTLRIWVPGCSTGEEAYSIAMVFVETIESLKRHFNIQIFATDLDREAIDYARKGVYTEGITSDLSPERLKRFFIQEGNSYRAKKQMRDLVVFSVHDLMKDPYFHRLDMISCRNLLIYMDSMLQKRILPLFHNALNRDGVLFLGTSETVGDFRELFSPRHLKWKIFKRKDLASEKDMERLPEPFYRPYQPPPAPQIQSANDRYITGLAEKLILENYAPTSVLVNEKYEILYFIGKTDRYLRLPTGEPRLNILRMVRSGLDFKLKTALDQAAAQKRAVTCKGIRLKQDGHFLTVDLVVKPVREANFPGGLMMVVFEEKSPSAKAAKRKKKAPEGGGDEVRIEGLERELEETREYLAAKVKESETSTEELQSLNEELQSTNEELETSREELQSTNEELITINAELQEKLTQLTRTTDDLKNLFSSTELGTIFLDSSLCIMNFTPAVKQIYNLIESDIGRPISDIASNIKDDDLGEVSQEVLGTLIPRQSELQTKNGMWYSRRILPYRTTENVIDGVVLNFVDISALKDSEVLLEDARAYAENIVETVREPLIILDKGLRVLSANRAFYDFFRVSEEETANKLLYKLGDRQWDIPKLRKLLKEVLAKKKTFEGYEVTHEFKRIGRKTIGLNARRIQQRGRQQELILLAMEEITGT